MILLVGIRGAADSGSGSSVCLDVAGAVMFGLVFAYKGEQPQKE